MVHSMALKNVSVESYKATIRTFRSTLVCKQHKFVLLRMLSKVEWGTRGPDGPEALT